MLKFAVYNPTKRSKVISALGVTKKLQKAWVITFVYRLMPQICDVTGTTPAGTAAPRIKTHRARFQFSPLTQTPHQTAHCRKCEPRLPKTFSSLHVVFFASRASPTRVANQNNLRLVPALQPQQLFLFRQPATQRRYLIRLRDSASCAPQFHSRCVHKNLQQVLQPTSLAPFARWRVL